MRGRSVLRARPSGLGALIGVAFCFAGLLGAESAIAADLPTERQILEALTAKRLMRCPRVEASGCRGARVPRADGNGESVNVEVYFEFGSALVGRRQMPQFEMLGERLQKIQSKAFLVIGHTDTKGSAEYNQNLSERRAEAVKRLLVQQFGLPADTLVAIGYGKSKLKNTADPFAGENRRVQVVNTEQKETVSR
ncbi:MAG: OmpA family protein [Pseudorhodoplanes sp.]|nr:MAG: OmpA family protein [Pseudorhodoplanes sp.]